MLGKRKRKFLRPNSPWIIIPVFTVIGVKLIDQYFGIYVPYVTPISIGLVVILTIADGVYHLTGYEIADEETDQDKDKTK